MTLAPSHPRHLLAASVLLLTCVLGGCAGSPSTQASPTPLPGGDDGQDDSTGADGGQDPDDDESLREAVECLQGEWAEDMGNLLAQWQNSSPAGSGVPVTALIGQNSLRVTDAEIAYLVDTVATTAPSFGPDMTGEAVTSGAVTLGYAAKSPTQLSIGPVIAQGVTSITRVYIGGELSTEAETPWDSGLVGDAAWWCEDDTLSLEPAVSGWIHIFTRA
ncbi:hypothetical protein [Microbacterium sp.]|uniref:hypothetical protein n=1 Tax=Microbacterium sp. TaxID=51671 RepID=UPI0039E6DDFF